MKFHAFVICAYGDSPYLESCVRSLMGQTMESDIICATSTPSPYIDGIMSRYGIPVAVRDGKSDIQDDWNFALAQADAAYVTIAHQDDMYARHYVEELWNAYVRWPDMTVFMTDAVTVRQPSETAVPSGVTGAAAPAGGVGAAALSGGEPAGRPKHPASGRLVYFSTKNLIKKILRLPLRLHSLADREWVKLAALRFGNPVMCPSCAYRKGYLPDPIFHSEYRFALDWDSLADMAAWPGRFICVEKPLLFYRVHDGAETKACIESHLRENEERRMFQRFWPDRFAEALMRYYRRSYDEYGKALRGDTDG